MATEFNNNDLFVNSLTSNVDIRSTLFFTDTANVNILSVGDIRSTLFFTDTGSLNILSASDSIFSTKILVTALTAVSAKIENFDGSVSIYQLSQSNANFGQVPIYYGSGWIPGEVIVYPGTKLHDFQLTAYNPYPTIVSSDTSYCGVAPTGSNIAENVWRIVRLRYNEAGFVIEQGLTVNTAWTARYISNYSLF